MDVSATFAGVPLIAADVTVNRGTQPGRFLVRTLPQSLLTTGSGTLALTFGGAQVQFADCAPDKPYMRSRSGRAQRWSILLLDRRRKWSQATVSGEYNVRKPDGTVDEETKKTPAELASLCGTAISENLDTSRLPSNVFPYVNWNATPVSEALDTLCRYVACEVCWQADDTFAIWHLGQGPEIPNNGQNIYPSNAILPATKPSKLTLIGGPTVYQSALSLAAVGQETDGTMKFLADLEYKPDDGWESEFPFSFPSLEDEEKDAAIGSVLRLFRVAGQAGGGLSVPGCDESVTKIKQYVLLDKLLDSAKDLDDVERTLPAFVSGTFWNYADVAEDAENQRYHGEFQILADKRCVLFPQPMFAVLDSADFNAPDLELTTSYQVLTEDGALVRLKRERTLGGDGGEVTLHRPEVFATIKTGDESNDTTAQAEAEADAYLDLFEAQYDQPVGEMLYAGVVPVSLTGKVAQVTYRVAVGRPCTTQVGRMAEFDVYDAGSEG